MRRIWSSDSSDSLFFVAIKKIVEQVTLLGIGHPDA
jgi:hypothetical protein